VLCLTAALILLLRCCRKTKRIVSLNAERVKLSRELMGTSAPAGHRSDEE
jgi:hypothetical protein